MTTEKLKSATESLLIKRGNNVESVTKMIDLHFYEALKTYPSAKASFIANFIRTIY